MSDATLPSPRSSSAAPTAGDGNRSDSSTDDGDSDKSLIQSAISTTKEDSLGEGEGKADSKQKRKRTSAKDQAILEAEYNQNPKPNKAARAEIVEKVDLNEKEVQIWFQNRRQINRRKSRPLLPHEIAAFGLGGMAALSSDPSPPMAFSSSQSIGEPATGSQEEGMASSPEDNTRSFQELQESPEPQHLKEREGDISSESAEMLKSTCHSLPPPILASKAQSSGLLSRDASSFSFETVIKSFSSTPGYLANRWNATNCSFSTPLSSQPATFVTPSSSYPIQQSSCPERIGLSENCSPSSQVRLSLSLDGKAELIPIESSPPRTQALRPSSSASVIPKKRMRGLQRSLSALPRLPSGRSRDARTWEFCCDAEARDELTTQAENESNGSAVAAISLLRSTSKSALTSNTDKHNAPSGKPDPRSNWKKPRLGRTMSSVARLQSTWAEPSKSLQSSKSKNGITRSPSGDSDKENWIPGEDRGSPRHPPLPSGRADRQHHSKPVLVDNFNVHTHEVYLGRRKNKRRKAANFEVNICEDPGNRRQVGEEVERFMRGEISPSKKGDLDCVQGLLSLSQGNWR